MEFLDINGTKKSSLIVPSTGGKIILFSGFKNPYKEICETRNSSLFMNSIMKNGKVRIENQTITRV
jgi:hypothetical protein